MPNNYYISFHSQGDKSVENLVIILSLKTTIGWEQKRTRSFVGNGSSWGFKRAREKSLTPRQYLTKLFATSHISRLRQKKVARPRGENEPSWGIKLPGEISWQPIVQCTFCFPVAVWSRTLTQKTCGLFYLPRPPCPRKSTRLSDMAGDQQSAQVPQVWVLPSSWGHTRASMCGGG